MYSDLDILGGLTPIKYPPFPTLLTSLTLTLVPRYRFALRYPTADPTGTAGVSTGEER